MFCVNHLIPWPVAVPDRRDEAEEPGIEEAEPVAGKDDIRKTKQ